MKIRRRKKEKNYRKTSEKMRELQEEVLKLELRSKEKRRPPYRKTAEEKRRYKSQKKKKKSN